MDSLFLSSINNIQSFSCQLSKNLEKSAEQNSENHRCGSAGDGAARVMVHRYVRFVQKLTTSTYQW